MSVDKNDEIVDGIANSIDVLVQDIRNRRYDVFTDALMTLEEGFVTYDQENNTDSAIIATNTLKETLTQMAESANLFDLLNEMCKDGKDNDALNLSVIVSKDYARSSMGIKLMEVGEATIVAPEKPKAKKSKKDITDGESVSAG